ncbi:MAG: DoxX family protein [Gammaproteobacteria bacterium]|nr:DoxX family protein [Gammaproteobacteria bacterium]
MNLIDNAFRLNDRAVGLIRPFDGLAPLLLRLYLAPIMMQAGWNKIVGFDNTVAWFDASLGLPLPTVLAALAAGTELFGGALLLVGLATRWISIPLMFTMLVAIFAVHWPNGWLALSDASSWLANDRVLEAAERKARAIAILREHGNYAWLTSRGPITVLNNGIEFASTYFIMLLTLFFTGGGRYTSVDDWLGRFVRRGSDANTGSEEVAAHAH